LENMNLHLIIFGAKWGVTHTMVFD
jgi:hypothetical protein